MTNLRRDNFLVQWTPPLAAVDKVQTISLFRAASLSVITGRVTRGRCYDFKNIFAEKFCEKLAFFAQNKAKLCKNWIIALLVFEKTPIFSPKIGINSRKL
jgi:hypothetical protein